MSSVRRLPHTAMAQNEKKSGYRKKARLSGTPCSTRGTRLQHSSSALLCVGLDFKPTINSYLHEKQPRKCPNCNLFPAQGDDFASGTSSKSTKLIHGGVRYLELAVRTLDWGQFKLVHEALRERENLMYIGPHLSSAVPILLPIYQWFDLLQFFVGLKLYDLIAMSRAVKRSEYVSPATALQLFPALNPEGLKGAMLYHDGLHNDARMNVSIALTAAHHGATVLNHVRVTGLLRDIQGRVSGVTAVDQLTPSSKPISIPAKVVVNATGAFCDELVQLAERPTPAGSATSPSSAAIRQPLVTPSSGTHLTLPAVYTAHGVGVLSPSSDGRVLFLLPWEGRTIAGTTDQPCKLDLHIAPTVPEVKFILGELQGFLHHGLSFGSREVRSAWAGIRPLIRDPSRGTTKEVTRSHLAFAHPAGGLITISGGKWTTYRQMAEDVVDMAVREGGLQAGPCRTKKLMLLGGHDYSDFIPIQLTHQHGLPFAVSTHLAHSYGD
eukprot:RCo030917